MTPDQVLAAFGGEVVRLPKPEERSIERKKTVAPIGIDDFDLAGTRVNVRFLFSQDSMHLAAVLLEKLESKSLEPSSGDYDHLARLLTARYWTPRLMERHNGAANEKDLVWTFPETIVELSYSRMPGAPQRTALFYRAVVPKGT